MNEQTKTHIEHANEIKQWKRSVDIRDRSIVILHNVIAKERKRIKAYQRKVEQLNDAIIQAKIDSAIMVHTIGYEKTIEYYKTLKNKK